MIVALREFCLYCTVDICAKYIANLSRSDTEAKTPMAATLPRALHARLGTCCAREPSFGTHKETCAKKWVLSHS